MKRKSLQEKSKRMRAISLKHKKKKQKKYTEEQQDKSINSIKKNKIMKKQGIKDNLKQLLMLAHKCNEPKEQKVQKEAKSERKGKEFSKSEFPFECKPKKLKEHKKLGLKSNSKSRKKKIPIMSAHDNI